MELFNLTNQGLTTGAPIGAMAKGMKELSKKNAKATMDDIPGPGLHWSQSAGAGEIRIEDLTSEKDTVITITGKEREHFVWLPSGTTVRLIPQNQPENAWSLGIHANGSCEVKRGASANVSSSAPVAAQGTKPGTQEALQWLSEGKTGVSSKTLCYYTMQVPQQLEDQSHPYDAADFNRCVLFLEQVPQAREEFHRIAEISPQWGKLIENWAHLEQTLEQEKRGQLESGETSRSIRQILDSVENKPRSFRR
jgi:hypothetical protein